jgi:hypothetical protein
MPGMKKWREALEQAVKDDIAERHAPTLEGGLYSVNYTVDVFAYVDVEAGKVTRVVVADEYVKLHPKVDRSHPAVQIAESEDKMWPAWEFGW